jgi:elongation factor Ts
LVFDKALEALRKKGLTKAEKKGDRETREGIIDSYVHSDRIGVVVEVNCETDFVARLPEFREFVHQMAMQIAAMNPVYPTMEDVPADIYEAKKVEFMAADDLSKKPEDIREKIVEGQLKKHFAEQVLSEQPFVLDDSITVAERIKQQVAKHGENLRVSQFKRIELGVTE